MSIRSRSVAAVCLVLCLCLARLSAAGVLYDGTLGTMPASQGWLYLTDPLGASATQSLDTGVTVLDTTPATSDSAGYFSTVHPGVGVLDRGAGYRVRFDVEIVSENHPSTNRAGFSVIALSSDMLGIELAFWEGEIWAQSGPAFTHAEGAAFTTTAMTEYDLIIVGSGYALLANGSPVLSGSLRDYSSHPNPVYSWTNFLFFGDNTSSADAEIRLALIEVGPIPEPGSLAVLALGLAGMVRRRRRT